MLIAYTFLGIYRGITYMNKKMALLTFGIFLYTSTTYGAVQTLPVGDVFVAGKVQTEKIFVSSVIYNHDGSTQIIANPGGGGGSGSSLGVGTGSLQAMVAITSPTTALSFSSGLFKTTLVDNTTAYVGVDYSSFTIIFEDEGTRVGSGRVINIVGSAAQGVVVNEELWITFVGVRQDTFDAYTTTADVKDLAVSVDTTAIASLIVKSLNYGTTTGIQIVKSLNSQTTTQAVIKSSMSNISDNTGTINAAGNPVHWDKLYGVPAGFADGTDDEGGGGGGGTSTLMVTTGSASGFDDEISTPTTHIVGSSSSLRVQAIGGSTAYMSVKFNHTFDADEAKISSGSCVISNSTSSFTSFLLCDDSLQENVSWSTVLYPYSEQTLSVKVLYSMVSAAADEVVLISSIACLSPGDGVNPDISDGGSVFGKSYAVGASITSTVPGTAGYIKEAIINPTDNSCQEGDLLSVYFERMGGLTADDASGDIEVRKVRVYEN